MGCILKSWVDSNRRKRCSLDRITALVDSNRWVGCILIRSGCKRAFVLSVGFPFLTTKEEEGPRKGRMCMLHATEDRPFTNDRVQPMPTLFPPQVQPMPTKFPPGGTAVPRGMHPQIMGGQQQVQSIPSAIRRFSTTNQEKRISMGLMCMHNAILEFDAS